MSAPPPNATFADPTASTCEIACNDGFLDCNGLESDGCETPASVGCTDGGRAAAERIATISAPRGLAACAGLYFVLDDVHLESIDATTLAVTDVATSPAEPADGLACDGAFVYWTTLADADASPGNGALHRVAIGGGAPEIVANGFDARSGIDVSDAGVFVMTSAGLELARSDDAGLIAWLPAASTGAYKPFTLTAQGEWSLDQSSIFRHASDAAAPFIDDAGNATALVTVNGAPIVARHALFDGAAPTEDDLATIEDDAGNAALAVYAFVHPVVATASGANAIVASDDTIYAITPFAATPLYTTPDHVVDVATDGVSVLWTTLGATTSAGVWRGQP